MVRLVVEGATELRQTFQAMQPQLLQLLAAGIDDITAHLAERAHANTPILKNKLRPATVQAPAKVAGSIVIGAVHVPNSDPASVYALWIHEGSYNLGPVSALQPPTEEGGVGNKFMSRVAFYHIGTYVQMIQRRISNLGKLTGAQRGYTTAPGKPHASDYQSYYSG